MTKYTENGKDALCYKGVLGACTFSTCYRVHPLQKKDLNMAFVKDLCDKAAQINLYLVQTLFQEQINCTYLYLFLTICYVFSYALQASGSSTTIVKTVSLFHITSTTF